MVIFQSRDPTNPDWVLEQLENQKTESNSNWVDACITRAIGMIKLHKSGEIDSRALLFNLTNIKNVTQDHVLYEDALRKNRLDDVLNPLIDKLKGA
jgi:serine/threonine protein phosphatase PrpC